jgi:hypothetical protein
MEYARCIDALVSCVEADTCRVNAEDCSPTAADEAGRDQGAVGECNGDPAGVQSRLRAVLFALRYGVVQLR